MSYERWGALSVNDHIAAKDLITELMLYDRLVIPKPDIQTATNEQVNEWKLDALDARIEQLGDRAIVRPWSGDRLKKYNELKNIQLDVNELVDEVQQALDYQMTRRVLAQEGRIENPRGVSHADVVCAFRSRADFEADTYLSNHNDCEGAKSLALGWKIKIPKNKKPEEILSDVVQFVQEEEFRVNRRKFYEWQNQKLNMAYSPKEALHELHELTEGLNLCVEKAWGKTYVKFGFALATAGLGLAAAPVGDVVAAGSALLAIVQFATFDKTPDLGKERATPLAMFHDIELGLGIEMKPHNI